MRRRLRFSSQGDSFPIGTILTYTGALSKIPAGWHLCDGSNGTPDLRNRFIMGWGGKSVGSYVDAGLPNITGEFNASQLYDLNLPNGAVIPGTNIFFEGAFGLGTKSHISSVGSDGDYYTTGMSFNAHWSNPIYGNSDTVQPPAYTVYYIMKIK